MTQEMIDDLSPDSFSLFYLEFDFVSFPLVPSATPDGPCNTVS